MMFKRFYILLLSFICFSWCACSSVARREAQHTISLADSLRAEGQLYSDSSSLVEAYTTLTKWRYIRPNDYSQACYHYGRLLRSKEHYPEAMKCFIDASRSHSRDYRLLGRVYSNIAYMCGEAERYDMAYSTYQKSAACFSQQGDSSLYFYSLNNMAWQLVATLNEDLHLPFCVDTIRNREVARFLLDSISHNCQDERVLLKTWETRAALFYFSHAYDSALSCINKLGTENQLELYPLALKAKCLYKMGNDSAFVLAKTILSLTSESNYSAGMYYILARDTMRASTEQILEYTSYRSDIQKALEAKHGQLTQATLIFQQDLAHPYDWRWLYVLFGLLALCGTVLGVHTIIHRQRLLKAERHSFDEALFSTIKKQCVALQQLSNQQLIETLKWNNYPSLCNYVNTHFNLFVDKLKVRYPSLKEREIRLCILTLINISNTNMADILNYSANGIGKFKYLVSRKLNTTSKNLAETLLKIATEIS